MSEPTTIIWYTLPSEGNKGAAFVFWRNTTLHTRSDLDYLLGDKPARYPVPATMLDCIVNHNQWRVHQYINRR